ncbi:tRNA (guanine(46)-N(7))-methyltransferase TrmB [Pelagibius litoralis]|uniref:tRNA (guanine(46)-N(7))-methyltransferase TrmB n=1 Tax=Pelagibius litoralis TaxID=374515 RepID=UPI002AC3439B|nr:tRNA (guanine(46)-N(7))-methyltransferase TrmB [Pelagibius litoralis]
MSPGKRNLYGRRQGRPLRAARRATLEERLPLLQIDLPEAPFEVSAAALFDPLPPRLYLEIGFGGGEHLAWQAADQPDLGIVAAEYFMTGVAGLLHQWPEGPQTAALRLFIGDARDLMERLPDALFDKIFILFPDPWPKRRHHKRRLIQPATVDLLARLLKDGGELRFATDDPGYLAWALERLTAHRQLAWQVTGPADWRLRPEVWPATRYEQKALRAGRQPAFLRFRKAADPD